MIDTLARFRVALGFAFGALVFWLAEPTPRSLLIGVGLASVGEAVRVWAAGHLYKSREVTMSGPYRWFAHPLYVGSSIIGAGLAIACASVAAGLAIGVYLAVTLTAAIKNEEAFLGRTFGDRYDAYRRGRTAADEQAARRGFSVPQVMANHEPRAVAGFVLAVLLLVLKATYNGFFWRTAAGR